jgi:hypothetical protein
MRKIIHCWADRAAHAEQEHGFGSTEWAEAYMNNATCFLEHGHSGPHEWTPDSQIVVTFSATPTPAGGRQE